MTSMGSDARFSAAVTEKEVSRIFQVLRFLGLFYDYRKVFTDPTLRLNHT